MSTLLYAFFSDFEEIKRDIVKRLRKIINGLSNNDFSTMQLSMPVESSNYVTKRVRIFLLNAVERILRLKDLSELLRIFNEYSREEELLEKKKVLNLEERSRLIALRLIRNIIEKEIK